MDIKSLLPIIIGIILLVLLFLGARFVFQRLASGQFPVRPPSSAPPSPQPPPPPPPAPPSFDLTTLRNDPLSLRGVSGRLEKAEVTSKIDDATFWIRGVGNDRVLAYLSQAVQRDPNHPPIQPGGVYTLDGQILELNATNLPAFPELRGKAGVADEQVFLLVNAIVSADLPRSGPVLLDEQGEAIDPIPNPSY